MTERVVRDLVTFSNCPFHDLLSARYGVPDDEERRTGIRGSQDIENGLGPFGRSIVERQRYRVRVEVSSLSHRPRGNQIDDSSHMRVKPRRAFLIESTR